MTKQVYQEPCAGCGKDVIKVANRGVVVLYDLVWPKTEDMNTPEGRHAASQLLGTEPHECQENQRG